MPALTRTWTKHSDLAIQRGTPVHRDEYLDHMTFTRNDRPLFSEIFGPLIGLKEEWEEQGASPEELSFSAFRYRTASMHGLGVATGFTGGDPEVVVEETETMRTTRDGMGRLMRLAKGASTVPIPITHPVETMDDWLRLKPHFTFTEDRFSEGWLPRARTAREQGDVVNLHIPGGYDLPRQLMGEENVSYALFDSPEMIHDMLDTVGGTVEQCLERILGHIPVDQLSVHEDMAGISGPMLSPDHVRTFIAPYYRRIWDIVHADGTRLFDQDSDGDMRAVIPSFLEAGVNCMHPMEPAANMDIVDIRSTYGDRLAFYGGIDKHVLRKSKDEITAELERKIPPLLNTGGCIFALDHRIPNGTPLENYRFYIKKVWELIEG